MFTIGSEEADGRERFQQDFLGGGARNIVEEAIAFCSLFFMMFGDILPNKLVDIVKNGKREEFSL